MRVSESDVSDERRLKSYQQHMENIFWHDSNRNIIENDFSFYEISNFHHGTVRKSFNN